MKKILMFELKNCPHCHLANRLLDELLQEERYQGIEIQRVEEEEQSDLANSYDYYYVPCFYVDGVKVHEGHIERDGVIEVLEAALK